MVTQSYGFQDPISPDHVCLLQRSLYGLKQSPRCWFERLRNFLKSIGFKESYIYPSLFLYEESNICAHLFVHVDDIVVTGSNEEVVRKLMDSLGKELSMRELGQLGLFWGIQVKHCLSGLHVSQGQYLANLLRSCEFEPHLRRRTDK